MPAVTEEGVQARRENVDKLREQLAREQAKAEEYGRRESLRIEDEQLAAEEARLEAQLAHARAVSKSAAVKAGADTVVEQAREQRAVAEAQKTAVATAVDEQNKVPTTESTPQAADAATKTEGEK